MNYLIKEFKKFCTMPNIQSGKARSYANAIIQEFETLLLNIQEENYNITFDTCSNRLRNVLYRNNIFTIGILKKCPIEYVLNLSFFGEKCLYELCNFLTHINSNEKNINCSNNFNTKESEFIDEITQKQNKILQCIQYIQNMNKKKFTLNINEAFEMYLKNEDNYLIFLQELITYLSTLSLYKLTPREQNIFNLRFGINEESQTLQEIGLVWSVSRERVRQILLKIEKKLKIKKLSKNIYVKLEHFKCKTIEKIETISIAGFMAYIYFKWNTALLKLIFNLIFNKPIQLKFLINELNKQYSQYKKTIINNENVKKYNNKILNLICFDKKRVIADSTFSRLKTERVINNEELFNINNQQYQCPSFLTLKMLEKFISNNTFKQIKTLSLKIPFGNNSFFYPDFQCLTHDNHFVIIEILPLIKMCENYNIKKIMTLKNYCEKYGFGYLVIDERLNSFFHINENNEEFNSLILSELNTNKKIKYFKYKEIRDKTNAKIKNFITLIKKENLKLSLPFLITK